MSNLSFSPILVTRNTCRICGSRALTPVVSLGDQYIAGAFTGPDGKPPVSRRIPLDLVRCDPGQDQEACGLVQLRNSVPPRILYRSYFYRSGINQSMRDHLAGITKFAEDTVKLQAGDLVVDIGCNDGTLLKSYRTQGLRILGIDPATNIIEYARKNGVQVVNDFFSKEALRSIYSEEKAKVITSIAMFYDLENPHKFVGDIKASLHEKGTWILELSYLPLMLKMNSFDTVCHEHLEYYSLAPMERLFAEHDLEVVDVTLNDCNGGSFRLAVGHKGKVAPSPEARDRVQQLRIEEFELALDTDAPYAVFRKNIEKIRKDLRAFLVKAKKQKKLVHGYGASTKGNTTLQYVGVTPDLMPAVADRNPDKFGSFTIGTNIPIIPEDESRKQKPDYYLVLPWHFITEFKKREADFLKRGGKFLMPMPEVHLVVRRIGEMKRAAITGIAGQDGTYLARGLLKRGYDVHGLLQFPFDREEPVLRRRYPADEFNAVHWSTGSLEDPFSLVRFLKSSKPDEIYHLAGLTDSRQSFLVPEESVLSITLGTLRLLEAAREICPGAKIFLASSAEVFGVPAETPQSETTLMKPVTPYGIAKLAGDQFGRLHREKYAQFVAIGMMYNHESPLRPANYLSRRVCLGVAAIKRGEAKELQLGDLSAERDWSDARDIVNAMWLSLQAQKPGDYVFASGQQRKVEEFVATAFRAAGLDRRQFVKTTSRTDNQQQVTNGLCGYACKAESELGWKRRWNFAAMVADLVQAELESRSEMDRANPLANPPAI